MSSAVDKDLIGTTEAAELLGCKRKVVVKLCEDGKLAGAFQPGGSAPGNHWRVPRTAVLEHRHSSRPRRRAASA